MEEKDRVRITYDPKITGSIWRLGEQVSAVKCDDGKFRYIINKHLQLEKETNSLPLPKMKAKTKPKQVFEETTAQWLPMENRETLAMATAKKKATKKTDTPAAPLTKAEKTFAEFGLRDGTNYARMMQNLIANLGKQVDVVELSKASYKDAQHADRVVTMARIVQHKIIDKGKLPYVITKEEKTIGLHTK